MNGHPRQDVFEGVLRSLSSEAAGVVLHILRCESCQLEAAALLAPAGQLADVFRAHPGAEIDFGRIWAFLGARDLAPEEAAEVLALLGRLRAK
jgi:hypothetical protein